MPIPTPTKTNHHDVYPSIDPSNPTISAAGKTVIITGGGQGIGAEIVKAFSVAGAANIVVLGRKISTLNETKAAVEALPKNKSVVSTYEADVTDQARINAVFDEVASTIGKIDVLVANAGYLPSPDKIATIDIEDFKRGFDINITGQLISIQAFLRNKAENSTFISVNTAGAHMYYLSPMASYVASKAALARLVDFLHNEHPDVRAFSIHPGIVPTVMAAKAGFTEVAKDTPQLAAAYSVWLASPESESLRGSFLWASWDVDELKAQPELNSNSELLHFGLTGWPSFKHQTAGPGEE